MIRRVLFTEEEYELIRNFLLEHNMFFCFNIDGVTFEQVDKVTLHQIKYLEQNTKGKARCPNCGRLYIGADEAGVGWCIKCDWN